MKDGIYHVTFSSNLNDFGEGIAVFQGGSVNGGDYGYVYLGTKISQDNGFSARLKIKRWNPTAQSVFGPATEFELDLRGTAAADSSFVANGHVVGQAQAKITIRGRYLSEVA